MFTCNFGTRAKTLSRKESIEVNYRQGQVRPIGKKKAARIRHQHLKKSENRSLIIRHA